MIFTKIETFISKINKFGDIFNFSLFVIFSLLLIFNVILNIYINSGLLVNLEKYVNVYNSIYGIKNSIILLISTTAISGSTLQTSNSASTSKQF